MLRLRVREVAQEKGISMSKLSRIADVNYKTIQTIWRDPYHGLNDCTVFAVQYHKVLEPNTHQ